MNSQMLVGGVTLIEETQLKSALEKRQLMLMQELDKKLQDFKFDSIEQDKAQAEKYKVLLIKQRDIMVALTTKLNERDESLVRLHDQIEGFEAIIKDQKEIIELLLERNNELEQLIKSVPLQVPQPSKELELLWKNLESNCVLLQKSKEIRIYRPSIRNIAEEKSYLPYQFEKNEKG